MQVCELIAVPMAGKMESLNCAVAGSILMFALSPGGAAKLSARVDQLGLQPLALAPPQPPLEQQQSS